MSNWKKRWFVLKAGFLYYFKKQEGDSAGVIAVRGATVQVADDQTKKTNSFSISREDSSRTYFIQASSPAERSEWMETIKKSAACVDYGDFELGQLNTMVNLLNFGDDVIEAQVINTLNHFFSLRLPDFIFLEYINKNGILGFFAILRLDHERFSDLQANLLKRFTQFRLFLLFSSFSSSSSFQVFVLFLFPYDCKQSARWQNM